MMALDGVTRHGLSEGVKAILKGALGHAFLPSPPELRMQCDKAMEWHVRERDRILRQQRIARDRDPPRREPTEAEKARVAKLYADFCEGYKATKAAEDGPKLDPALVALVPDAPSTFKRPKVA